MATEPRFGRAAGKLSRSGRDRQRGVPAWATAALPGPQRPAVKSPGRSAKPPAVREIDLDSSGRQWCYDLSQLHELVASTLIWSRSVSYRRTCRWEIWPALFEHAERDIGILDLCRRWLGGGYGGQGAQQPPRCPPDRLGEYRACPAFRPWCQRRPDQQRIQVIEQPEIAPPIERGQRGLSRLGELGGEVGGDAGLGRPGDQGGGIAARSAVSRSSITSLSRACPSVAASHFSCASLVFAGSPDDQDWAGGVVHAVMADRAEQGRGELAMSPAAHH